LSLRGYVRFAVLGTLLAGASLTGGSCYRAEVDLAPLLYDSSQSGGGGMVTVGAGEAGMGGSAGAKSGGGTGGASAGADGGATDGAGGAADGGASGAADRAAGSPTCDPTPEDAVQYQCRRREPSKEQCDEQDVGGWNGCYNGGCSVCTEILIEYPYYLERHRCCHANATCGVHEPVRCSPLCPPPTELDKRPLCFNLER
jgi:hypothetical protein